MSTTRETGITRIPSRPSISSGLSETKELPNTDREATKRARLTEAAAEEASLASAPTSTLFRAQAIASTGRRKLFMTIVNQFLTVTQPLLTRDHVASILNELVNVLFENAKQIKVPNLQQHMGDITLEALRALKTVNPSLELRENQKLIVTTLNMNAKALLTATYSPISDEHLAKHLTITLFNTIEAFKRVFVVNYGHSLAGFLAFLSKTQAVQSLYNSIPSETDKTQLSAWYEKTRAGLNALDQPAPDVAPTNTTAISRGRP